VHGRRGQAQVQVFERPSALSKRSALAAHC